MLPPSSRSTGQLRLRPTYAHGVPTRPGSPIPTAELAEDAAWAEAWAVKEMALSN